ncbi:MAG: hypothetical protein ACXIVE_09065 [Salinarimonas sp.]
MARVARKLGLETWRDAVARRGGKTGAARACLEAFDAYREAGESDFIAAYRALEDHDCLDHVILPGDPEQPLDEAENDQIEPPGS